MSTQTIAAMQTIARTLAGGGGEDPPPNPRSQSQNPQRIRDTLTSLSEELPDPLEGLEDLMDLEIPEHQENQ
jgi:hypothetical protein